MNNALAQFAEMAWSKVVFIAIVVAALFYLVGVDKGVSEQEFANAENQRKQAEVTLKKTKDAMADLKKFRSQIDDLNNQFNQLTAYMGHSSNFADFVLNLQKIASQSGATIRKISPSNKSEQVDFYETSKVEIELEGNYQQLVSFLSGISKTRRLVTVEDLDMSGVQGGDVKSGRIAFKATLVGYRYNPPATGAPNPSDPSLPGAPNAH